MPMTVKVGLAKKVGQPDFGSLGASCEIELELDGSLLSNDLEGLQERVRTAYVTCRQAVNDELASQMRIIEPSSSNTPAATPRTNGGSTIGKGRVATSSQVRALHAIATRQGFNLTVQLQERFHIYREEDLSLSEASRLIDDLNAEPIPAEANGSGEHA